MLKNLRKAHRARAAFVGALTATALALSACTPSGEDNAGQDKSAGNSSVATGGKDFGDADKKTAEFGSDAQPGQFPREVKHAMGTTKIESEPKRVVVLDTGELDSVLALGLTPVGMVTTKGANPVPSYFGDKVKDVDSVGTINELNVEKIAELKPDLIIGSQLRAEKLYPQLNEIAPTVFAIRPGFTWKENFKLAGEALGREKQAEKVMQDYDKKIREIKGHVKPDTTVSMVRFMPGKLRLYGHKSLIGVILRDAGLKRPESQDLEELAAEISPEEIDKAEADYVFYSSYGDPDATGETEVINGSAWKGLTAVKEGRAHRVNDDLWGLGLGPMGATMIVEQLQDFVTK